MKTSLLRKEWAQARLNVLGMLAGSTGLWLFALEDTDLLLPEPYEDQLVIAQAMLAVFAAMQLAVAQFASESLWKTRDLLVFRASGPAAAFRAKCLVGAAATTLFAVGPALVWSAWQYASSPWADTGLWSRVGDFALVGTLGWAAWGAGALCCQLRHGWGARVVAVMIAGAGLFGAAALASTRLASAPPWADWLFPLASAVVGIGLAWCAGRAFTASVDEEVALRDGAGLALAAGIVLAAGFPFALVGPALSRFATDRLRASYRHVVETPGGELELATLDETGRILMPLGTEPDPSVESALVRVLDPHWLRWGWPEPDARLALVVRREPFALGGTWTQLTGWPETLQEFANAHCYYESRNRRVHLFVHAPEARHVTIDLGCSANTLIVWPGRMLADLEHKTLTLVKVEGAGVSLEPLALPGGDEFRGVERLVTRAWAEVGYRAPFDYENGLLIAGERGLYRLNQGVLEPYVRVADEPFTAAYGPGRWKRGIAVPPETGDASIAASDADRLVRLRSRYARYDALDPTIEVLNPEGERVFGARLAPPGPRTEGLKALACAAGLGHAPIASLASFVNRAPWRERSLFDNPSLLGGRRPWLLFASFGVAAWLAWQVRRETRAWGRSPLLGAFWIGATLLLGFVGWILFRIAEPRPALALGVATPRRTRASARAELAPTASGLR